MQKAPNRNPAPLFSPFFSGKTEKKGPPEARQKRPRRNEPPQATSLFLCARFFLSKPQTKFAVWVLSQICDNLSVSLRLTAPLEGEPCGEKSPPRGCAGASFYCFNLVLSAKNSFVSFATTPERAKRAMKFGMAMRPLKVSAMSHTTSSEATAPTTTMMMNRT